jgi:nucleoside-diphosphate-sugar epimerase
MSVVTCKPLTVGVTGASGFIGQIFVKRALQNGWRVKAFCRKGFPRESFGCKNLSVIYHDISVQDDYTNILDDVDILVNLAAELYNEELMPLVNVNGTKRLLNAAISSGVKRWLQISTCAVYDTSLNSGCIDENSSLLPCSAYAKSKLFFDQLLQESKGIEVVIIRPSIVYGGGMRNQSLYGLAKMVKKGIFFYIGSNSSVANYIHVDDLVGAITLCVTSRNAANRIYNISNSVPLKEMIEALAKAFGINPPTMIIPVKLVEFISLCMKLLPGWPLTKERIAAMTSKINIKSLRAHEELGWSPNVTIQQGVVDLIKKIKLNK